MEELDIKSLYERELEETMAAMGENLSRDGSCLSGCTKRRWEAMDR